VKRVVDKEGVGCIESAPMLGSVLSASFAAAARPHSRSRGVWVSIGWLCVKRAASALLLCCLFVVVQATCAAGKVCAGPCCVSQSIGSAREFGGGRSALLRALCANGLHCWGKSTAGRKSQSFRLAILETRSWELNGRQTGVVEGLANEGALLAGRCQAGCGVSAPDLGHVVTSDRWLRLLIGSRAAV
jgi:hypothetical protein